MLHPNRSQTTSTAAPSSSSATSTVRPRPKRLISGLSDGDDNELPVSPALPPSPYDSRSASPIPSAHPQRPGPRNAEQKFNSSSWGRRAQGASPKRASLQSPASPSLAGIWGSSWTTLQGIASDFLGNDAPASPVKDNIKRPLPKWYRQMTTSASRDPLAPQWGPTPMPTSVPAATVTDIGKGTKQEREAAMRAQKRKDMLLRQDSSYADTLGKFKRRLSDDLDTRSAPPGEHDDRAALVYIHPVAKEDTMAGITIKYNCSANVLRKANRMWANDTPQSRHTMMIPVAECGVKGRPVDDMNGFDVPRSNNKAAAIEEGDDVTTPRPNQANGTFSRRDRTGSETSTSSSAAAVDSEPPWQHDSWVQLPGFIAPTEIARLSRRALGYFPPARRKSQSRSAHATPSTSLDLARVSTEDRHDSRSPQRPRRGRRYSGAHAGYFPSYLAGPGGVGTMNKNVRTPGPAQDGLNKIFAKHLPDVAPPRNQIDLYQPEVPLYTDEPTPSTSGLSTPTGARVANANAANMNLNLENVGGAIESWVRRMASKAMTPTEAQARGRAARASVGTPGKGAGGIGDLIEMTDEFEIGGDEEDDNTSDFDFPGRRAAGSSMRALDDSSSRLQQPQRGRPSSSAGVAPGRGLPSPSSFSLITSSSGADYFGEAAVAGKRERRRSPVKSGSLYDKGRKGD